MKRGPKSAADLSVVAISGARVPAPEYLTPGQREEWTAIVDSLPADWFRPADCALLVAYCAASALYKEALQMIQSEGIVIDEGKGRRAHPAKDILTSQAAAMAQMAVKLRLCPSARYTEKAAGTATKNTASGKKPWDTGTDD